MIRFSYAVAFSLTLGGIIWLCLTWHNFYTDFISGILMASGVLVAGITCIASEAIDAEQRIKALHDQAVCTSLDQEELPRALWGTACSELRIASVNVTEGGMARPSPIRRRT